MQFTLALLSASALLTGTTFADYTTYLEGTDKLTFTNIWQWTGPSIVVGDQTFQASGMTSWDVQGEGENAMFVQYVGNYVDMGTTVLADNGQVQVGTCNPDTVANRLTCSAYTWEQSNADDFEMKFFSWNSPASSEFLAPTEEETKKTWKDFMTSSSFPTEDTIVFDGEIKNSEGNFTRSNKIETGPDLVRAESGTQVKISGGSYLTATTFQAAPVALLLEAGVLEAAKTGLTTYAGRQYLTYISKDDVVTPFAMKDMVLSSREVVDDKEENTADGEGTVDGGEGTEDGGAEGDNTEEDDKPVEEETPVEEEKPEPISNAQIKEEMDAMIVRLEAYLAQEAVEGAFAAATFGSLAVAVAATLAM